MESNQATQPEAVKIDDDVLDFTRVGDENMFIGVSRREAIRVLRRAFRRGTKAALEYKEFSTFLHENIGTPADTVDEYSGTIRKVSPTQLSYEDEETRIIVPGKLRELDSHCVMCGRFGRIKCPTCPMRACSWACDKKGADVHDVSCKR